ncbi:MAG: DNA primase [Burkholderiaceae bacterium]
MIPQAFIEDLLARLDVVEVVGRAVKLRKAGANMLGLCPFHQEKSPSFTVSPAKQFYHCFGCQAHGSAIGFVMAYQGLGYVEAIEELARSVGMVVPREPGRGERPGQARAPGLLDALEQAGRFYARSLRESERAIGYLKGRGLSGRTAKRFGLGYAPPGWRNLEAATADYDDHRWVEAGLVQAPDDGDEPAVGAAADPSAKGVTGEPSRAAGAATADGAATAAAGTPSAAAAPQRRRRYDRFRDRIMFPIRNARGATIGFGARVLDRGEPKYLNSPETPVFSKGHELYGLFESRQGLRRLEQAIVVEGYMDVVMLAEHGIDNAVATLGTATTPDHVRKLLRQVDHLVFGFDGDAAGRKAAWRALQACLPMMSDTSRVEFLFFPDGDDPDSFVRARGEQAFREAVASATPLSTFLLDQLSGRTDLGTPEGRARFLAEARPLLQAVAAEALRLQLERAVADRAGVGLAELARYLQADDRAGQVGRRDRGSGRHDPDEGKSGAWPDVGDDRSWPTAPFDVEAENAPDPGRGVGGRRWPSGRGPSGQGNWGRRRPGGPGAGRGVPLAVRGGGPSLERRLRLLALCHPSLAEEVVLRDEAMSVLPAGLRDWFAAMAGAGGAGTPQSRLEALPEALAAVGALAARDLGEGRVPMLDLDEARIEFEGALQRLADKAVQEAAAELIAGGLADPESQELYRALLASRRES